jgi:hypothetical protein
MFIRGRSLGTLRTVLVIGLLCSTCGFGIAHAKEQKPERPPDGLVVGRLVNNLSRLNDFFLKFTSISVKGGPRNSTHTLSTAPTLPILKQTTAPFAELLPPGRYQITELGATAGNLFTDSKLPAPALSFEVTSGGVIDLGLLLVQPIGAGKAVLLPTDEPTSVEELLRTHFPEQVANWLDKPITRWSGAASWVASPFDYGATNGQFGGAVGALITSSIEKGMRLQAQTRWQEAKSAADYLKIAKTTTTALSEPAVSAEGTMYFGSILGQVQRRAPDGTWTQIDTGQLTEISAVMLLDDQTLLVGTEDGWLLQQQKPTDEFTVVRRFAPGTRILDLQRWSNGAWWVATRGPQVKGTAPTRIYGGNSIAEIDTAVPLKTLREDATPAASAGKYFFGVAGVESHVYDNASATWSAPAVKKAALQPIANNSGSVLLNMKPLQISTDNGLSWAAVKDPGRALYVAFFNNSDGLAVRAPAALGTPDLVVEATTDAGKSWSRVNTLPKFPCDVRSLRQNDVQKRIFCVFHDGSINSSGMQGDWVLERIVY